MLRNQTNQQRKPNKHSTFYHLDKRTIIGRQPHVILHRDAQDGFFKSEGVQGAGGAAGNGEDVETTDEGSDGDGSKGFGVFLVAVVF